MAVRVGLRLRVIYRHATVGRGQETQSQGTVDVTTIEINHESYSHSFSPHVKPIARVRPGQTVVIHTQDALGGRIRSESDLPSAAMAFTAPNPVTGPIFVEGAEPGDTLAVSIKSIEPARDYAFSCFVPNMGGLTSTKYTRSLQDPIPERTWIWPLREGAEGMYLENAEIRVRVPWRPFMGSIGVAPAMEAISSLSPGMHGGNMDCPDVRPGNTLHLPVSVDGALFSAGDGHANQGQGELCGVALEIPCRLSIVFGVEKGKRIAWPRIVSDDAIMVVGSAKPMDDAARIAYAELVLWLEEEFGFDRWQAYQLLGQVGRLYVANMVNPVYSLVASVEKRYLRRG
jgi:acetamidase/formamidase